MVSCSGFVCQGFFLGDRRLEVVADGLFLWHGAPLHSDGTARRRAADIDGAALEVTRSRKERTYPELAGEGFWHAWL